MNVYDIRENPGPFLRWLGKPSGRSERTNQMIQRYVEGESGIEVAKAFDTTTYALTKTFQRTLLQYLKHRSNYPGKKAAPKPKEKPTTEPDEWKTLDDYDFSPDSLPDPEPIPAPNTEERLRAKIKARVERKPAPAPIPEQRLIQFLMDTLGDIASGRGMFGVDLEEDLRWAMKYAQNARETVERQRHPIEIMELEQENQRHTIETLLRRN